MSRNAFYSFHYAPDNWRASMVRNIGVIEGNRPCSDNDWETIKKGGEERIKKWINEQMYGKSCVIVLIGSNTAGRYWIDYEITKGWSEGKGLLGIYVHNLKDKNGIQSAKGENPFSKFNLQKSGTKLSTIVKAYDPPNSDSQSVYACIKNNLAGWVEEAIRIRGNA